MGIGQKIVELREEKGLSRTQLAEAMGITYHALSKYETDDRQIDHDLLIAFADFFGRSVDYLVGRQTPEVIIEMVRQVVFHSLDDIEIKPTGLI